MIFSVRWEFFWLLATSTKLQSDVCLEDFWLLWPCSQLWAPSGSIVSEKSLEVFNSCSIFFWITSLPLFYLQQFLSRVSQPMVLPGGLSSKCSRGWMNLNLIFIFFLAEMKSWCSFLKLHILIIQSLSKVPWFVSEILWVLSQRPCAKCCDADHWKKLQIYWTTEAL